MSRDTIFDLVKKNYSIEREIEKIYKVLYTEIFFGKFARDRETKKEYCVEDYSFFEFADKFLFSYLPDIGTCLNIEEFIETVDAKLEFGKKSNITQNNVVNFLEIIENLLFIYFEKFDILKRKYGIDYYSEPYKEVCFLMDELEQHLGYSTKKYTDRVILHSSDYKLSEAIEKVEDIDIAWELIRYKREQLDYRGKRKILKQLDRIIEPLIDKVKENETKASLLYKMADDLGCLFNNFDLRHNNSDKNSKDYKAFLDNYTDVDYVKVYDITYDLILNFLVVSDYNNNVQEEVKKLKSLL